MALLSKTYKMHNGLSLVAWQQYVWCSSVEFHVSYWCIN